MRYLGLIRIKPYESGTRTYGEHLSFGSQMDLMEITHLVDERQSLRHSLTKICLGNTKFSPRCVKAW